MERVMPDESTDQYLLGATPAETRRLQAQGGFFAASSDRLLRLAGIQPGMRVLDIGCGAGDMTMQIASIIGESGRVTGVDVDAAVLSVARERAAEAGLANVDFRQARVPDVSLDGPVNAITGRMILMHLENPAAALGTMRHLLAPGGIMAFQEVRLTSVRSIPPVPLLGQCVQWASQAFTASGRDPDTGHRLLSVFGDAGLPVPEMMAAIPTARGPAAYALAAGSVVSLLPVLERAGITTYEEVDPDTLAQRLWEQARADDALLMLPELIGAWAQIPA
jgi:SAM-dependent methyltransferase